MNQRNQTHQSNQPVLALQATRLGMLADFFSILLDADHRRAHGIEVRSGSLTADEFHSQREKWNLTALSHEVSALWTKGLGDTS